MPAGRPHIRRHRSWCASEGGASYGEALAESVDSRLRGMPGVGRRDVCRERRDGRAAHTGFGSEPVYVLQRWSDGGWNQLSELGGRAVGCGESCTTEQHRRRVPARPLEQRRRAGTGERFVALEWCELVRVDGGVLDV